MTVRTCRAPGCGARTNRYGAFCPTHRSRSRRHGHPEQESITKADLTQHLKLVRARIARNESSPLWAECEARWNAVLEHARRVLAAFRRGQAGYRCESNILMEVLLELKTRGVVGLGLHDGLMVPQSRASEVRQLMEEASRQITSHTIPVTTEYPATLSPSVSLSAPPYTRVISPLAPGLVA